jgi:predicted transcriptional regulator
MTPLPTNPTVVALTDEKNGKVIKVASNIAELPELTVIVTTNPVEFYEAALGKPFNQSVQ